MSRPHPALLVGTGLVAGSAVTLQVVLTRLFSALFGHHLAFAAISLSMLGVGVGGVLSSLLARDDAALRARGLSRAAELSGAAAGATVALLVWMLQVKVPATLDAPALGSLGAVYLLAAVPFSLGGAAIALVLRWAGRGVGVLYWYDLLGAAVGGVLAVPALRIGAPRAMLVVGIALAAGGLALALAARRSGERPVWGVVSTFALASVVLLLGDVGAPWIKLPSLRWAASDRVEFSAWNELALVTVDRPVGGMAWMRMDGSAATAILDAKTAPVVHPDQLAYALPAAPERDGPALVIGAGGGRDVAAALKAGKTDVVAVEVNRAIVEDVMRGKYRAFSGGLYDRPEVRVVVADGRHHVRSSPQRYASIVVSLVDTWAASSVGALSLSENGLYTAEAFGDFVSHLTDRGVLVVNRWDAELPRLLGLAVAGLAKVGAADPRKHLYACSAERSTALVVARAPLDGGEIRALRSFCRKGRFLEVLAPDVARGPGRAALDAAVAAARPPATDDRPFFFYGLEGKDLLATLRSPLSLGAEQQGVLLVLALALLSAVLGAPLLVIPVLRRAAPAPSGAPVSRAARLRLLLYFGAIGLGFVLVETALVQALTTFLGHPVHALGVSLVLLLLGAGLGSLVSARVGEAVLARGARQRGLLAATMLLLAALALAPLLAELVGLPFGARVLVAAVVAMPLGFAMGGLAPLGLRIASSYGGRLPSLAWGWNGFASVVGASAGTLVALHLGYSAVIFLGAVTYWAAAALVPEAAPEPVTDVDLDEIEALEQGEAA